MARTTEVPMTSRALDEAGGTDLSFPLRMAIRGPVAGETVAYARRKVALAARLAPRAIIRGSVVITWEPNPRQERRVSVDVTLDVGNLTVLAHADGHDGHEAVDLAEARLRRRLDRLADRR